LDFVCPASSWAPLELPRELVVPEQAFDLGSLGLLLPFAVAKPIRWMEALALEEE